MGTVGEAVVAVVVGAGVGVDAVVVIAAVNEQHSKMDELHD
jgi:hypothetical protein